MQTTGPFDKVEFVLHKLLNIFLVKMKSWFEDVFDMIQVGRLGMDCSKKKCSFSSVTDLDFFRAALYNPSPATWSESLLDLIQANTEIIFYFSDILLIQL